MPISKNYIPAEHEDRIYKMWEESGVFKPSDDPAKTPYTIIMPPPNATGTLHLGHAMGVAIQDALIRWRRMQGYAALWLPGTDHAAIATNAKVEKMVNAEGKTKEDLGREVFVQRVKDYVAGSQDTIRKQMRATGASADWSREKYTMDEDVSQTVTDVFVRMYNDGLIYRGHRIVNWCPHCQSTLADDEVEYREEKSKFYYFKYGPVVIGTARPETKFADKTIIVHPDDARYADLVGKKMTVPWIEGDVEATVIADPTTDKDFGSGAMTITPAHSFEDFALAEKYGLDMPQIIDERGNLTAAAGEFAGKNARQAREQIVEKLAAKGLVDHVDENYTHNLSICYRCDTPIEPLISDQWFIDVDKPVVDWKGEKKSLKQIALEVVKGGEIKIVPERFEKIYYHWMENLHNWCISRQIWWGHQLPVWYRPLMSGGSSELKVESAKLGQQEIYVGKKAPEGDGWTQDPDTLDTWFSSGMWTFSTLGWSATADAANQASDFQRFHPTDVLETSYDIIFFWVARMILMTTYATKQIPFKTVYFHGLVRDKQGRKMSKSLGNGIDPLDMIAKYGADAMRLSLVVGVTPGNDTKLSEDKIAGYRNFANKLWNIARYIEGVLEKERGVSLVEASKQIQDEAAAFDATQVGVSEQWILSRLFTVSKEATADMENFRLSAAADRVFHFVWNEYADWYLETTKGRTNDAKVQLVLLTVLEQSLRLLHPFMPFVTEALWKEIGGEGMLISQSWASQTEKYKNPMAEKQMGKHMEAVEAIRSLKNMAGPVSAKNASFMIYPISPDVMIDYVMLRNLTRVDQIVPVNREVPDVLAILTSIGWVYFGVTRDNKPVLIKNLQKKSVQLEKFIMSTKARLASADFTAKAPEELIAQTRTMLAEAEKKLAAAQVQLGRL